MGISALDCWIWKYPLSGLSLLSLGTKEFNPRQKLAL